MTAEFVIFDTEYEWDRTNNPHPAKPGTFLEILQIGALRVRRADLAITGMLKLMVAPARTKTLSPQFLSVTAITMEQLQEQGQSFAEAAVNFLAFCHDTPVYAYGYDADIFISNAMAFDALLPLNWPYTAATNLHPWFAALEPSLSPINSGRLARALGAPMDESVADLAEHDALFDTYSIHAALRYMRATRGANIPE